MSQPNQLILSFPHVELPSSISQQSSFNIEEFSPSEIKYNCVEIYSNDVLVSHEKMTEILGCLEAHAKITINYSKSVNLNEAEMELKLSGIISLTSTVSEEGVKFEGIKADLSKGTGMRRPLKSKDVLKAFLSSETTPAGLIDDTSLLKEEDLIKSSAATENSSTEECGPKAKKKACKNCSCGLKEMEEKEEAVVSTVIDTTNAKSSCGSVRLLYHTLYYINHIIIIISSVIWVMLSDAPVVHIVAFLPSNPVSKSNFPQICCKTI